MGSDDAFLMFVALDECGRRDPAIPTAIMSRRCAQGLIGAHRAVAGAVLEPRVVLDDLDTCVPQDREARSEYSAVLELALIAEARGLVLGCDGEDPTSWTPAQHRHYLSTDVQTALSFVAEQLDCTVDQAAHRLFAVVDESGASLIMTSRDVISGRLSFIGDPTGPAGCLWTRDNTD